MYKSMRGRGIAVLVVLAALITGCATPRQVLTVSATRAGEQKSDAQAAYDLVASFKNRDNVIIIYDASGSMRWPVKSGGAPRFKEAHKAFADYVQRASQNNNVGLMVFGSRQPSGIMEGVIHDMAKAKVSCNDDIEVRVPLGKLSAATFQGEIGRLQSSESYRGDTPIGNAVTKAADLLAKAVGARKHIILITDGAEECWQPDGKGVPGSVSPKDAIRSATGKGIDVSIVSFGIGRNKEGTVLANQKDTLASLKSMATGVFVEANTGEELFAALMQVEIERFPFALMNTAGQEVGRFVLGQSIQLTPKPLEAGTNIQGSAKNLGKSRYTVVAKGEREFRVDLALPWDRPRVDVFLGLKSRDDASPDVAPDEYRWKQ